MYLNKVYFAGNLGADPKTFNNGDIVSLFVIHNNRYKLKDGTQREESCAMPVKVFGFNAKRAAKFRKGDNVVVDGMLIESKYNDKEGKEMVSREVKAFCVEKVEKEKETSDDAFEF